MISLPLSCADSVFGSNEVFDTIARIAPVDGSIATIAPVLLPSDHTQVRRSLNQWFNARRIHPVVAGEFDDSALLFWIGRGGSGVFPAPTVIEGDVKRELGVRLVGRTDEVRERFYAISLDAEPKHPAVAAICAAGRPSSGRGG